MLKTGSTAGNTKRHRNCELPEVDKALLQWFNSISSSSITGINGPILQSKAQQFCISLGYDTTISLSWINRWKARHGITFKRVYGESLSANIPAANDWRMNTLQGILQKYPPENIINADETGLFWKALPETTSAFRRIQCKGAKQPKDCITVLLASSMAGK